MNVLLLAVALAAPVEAPKTGLQEATAAIAAVAPDEVVPEAHGSPLATANAPTLREAPACVAPWSAARRLAAAKLRKDAEEERRMKAKVGESVKEALGEMEN